MSEQNEYDYIVIGSGSAGSVIARRLVDSDVGRVALIEAGGPDHGIEEIGRAENWRGLWGGPYDWAYQTVPQKDLRGRTLGWPRGRILGGTSSINGMIYVRGHRLDYDAWEYDGCHGWGWDSVFPLFLRSENHQLGSSAWHSDSGPLPVSRVERGNPLTEAFIEGARSIGIPENTDFNGASMFGVGTVDTTTSGGERVSASRAFLWPVLDHPRLSLHLGTRVNRLVIEAGRCVGVEVAGSDGALHTIRARREVIVSAGVIESPAILLRSGIGDAAALRSLGIDPVVHAPGVGENLHDHLVSPVTFETTAEPPRPGGNNMDTMLFWKTHDDLLVPDLQPLLMHFVKPVDGYPVPEHGFTIAAGIVRPKARGRLTLRSADPFDAPVIDPAYLSQRYDREALVDALEIALAIGSSAPFAPFGTTLLAPDPGRRGRAELEEYGRRTCIPYHHQVGTCRMGVDDDAVVDPELTVRGVEALRVADASIMPTIPSVNTHAPAMMIGEKAAELLLGDRLVLAGAGVGHDVHAH
ncbi:GMC family oxidoreductase [Jiangella endophytica]|uniref:GMC family oxidoreductase n=1 Tax=Jiangella endophytica TaxID=1623398 RepID=UPI000E354FFE|nr:GMC family oxidoreductase N-terminal domain-containing protein [Jiangella endophytica]